MIRSIPAVCSRDGRRPQRDWPVSPTMHGALPLWQTGDGVRIFSRCRRGEPCLRFARAHGHRSFGPAVSSPRRTRMVSHAPAVAPAESPARRIARNALSILLGDAAGEVLVGYAIVLAAVSLGP